MVDQPKPLSKLDWKLPDEIHLPELTWEISQETIRDIEAVEANARQAQRLANTIWLD